MKPPPVPRDLMLDHAAIAYGPVHASLAMLRSEDCAGWRDRIHAAVDFELETKRQVRDLHGRLEWEHRYCDEPRERYRLQKEGKKPDRDWVFEEHLRARRRTAKDPASACSGCPLSYFGETEMDRSLAAVFSPRSNMAVPDAETRRKDVEAHRWKRPPRRPRGVPPKPRQGDPR